MKAWNLKTSLSARIAMLSFAFIVIGAVVIGVLSFILYRSNAIDSSGQEALSIAQSVQAAIDTEEYQALTEASDTNEYWDSLKLYLDEVKEGTDVEYLYALASAGATQMMYIAEGKKSSDDVSDVGVFGEIEPEGVFADEAFDTLATGNNTITDIYDSEGFGMMVSAFVPIRDGGSAIIGVVGVDISVDDVLRSSNLFGLIIIIIIAGISILAGVLISRLMERSVGRPINELSEASRKIAKGDMDIKLDFQSEDELGKLIRSFKEMVESTNHQTEVLEAIAGGDLTVMPEMRSENDSMSSAMRKMVQSLKDIVGRIRNGTEQLSASSKQIADGATVLAQGAIEQTTVVQELSVQVDGIVEKINKNAQMANQAAGLAGSIEGNAAEGSENMNDLIKAVQDINDASDAINKIIKVIDDIAFQTNILALNAAVEAARAGEHGKGFAVVADEVRNLAAKSADAAKETGILITDTIEKASDGARIAEVTSESLQKIVEGIHESNEVIGEIAEVSEAQNEEIKGINNGIEQVSQVVQQNSATAEESAAASEEMNGQAEMLHGLVSHFKTDE